MQKKIVFALAALAATAILPFSVFADTNTDISNQTNTAQNQITQTTQSTVTIPPLLQHIYDAKQMLQNVELDDTIVPLIKTIKRKKVQVGYMLSTKDAALAIWDPAANQIDIVKGTLSATKFNFTANPNITVKQNAFNGVNTNFTVEQPVGGVVLALKYLLSNPDSGNKANIEAGLQPIVYVPYSPDLSTQEIADAGAAYLDKVMDTVVFQLNQIQSASVPGEKLTDAIKPSIIKALIYAEHTSGTDFNDPNSMQDLINRLNILFATNQDQTFGYSVSSGGARGIAQFIPSTYLGVVQRHPYANLISDPIIGLNDQINSIKAEYLLIDDYIAAVHARIADAFNPAYSYDYGAAAYNGGVSRVAKAVETFGDSWNVDPSAQTATLQAQINGEQEIVKTLKNQIAATKDLGQKSDLKNQLANESSTLSNLKSELSSIKTTALRKETIFYLNKMHLLIQVLNGQNSSTTAAAPPPANPGA